MSANGTRHSLSTAALAAAIALPCAASAQDAAAPTAALAAAPCTLEGGALMSDDPRRTPYLMAASADRLYLYQRPLGAGDHFIEAWTVDTTAGCVLTNDTAFGEDGRIPHRGILGTLDVVDERVIVGRSVHAAFDAAGQQLYECGGIQWLGTMAPDPSRPGGAWVVNGSDEMQRWTFTDTECSGETAYTLPEGQFSYYFESIDGDVVGLYLHDGDNHIVRWGADGSEVWRWGARDGEGVERLNAVKDVAVAGERVLVLNGASIHILSADGAYLSTLEMTPQLVGLDTWQALHLESVDETRALVAIQHTVDDERVMELRVVAID